MTNQSVTMPQAKIKPIVNKTKLTVDKVKPTVEQTQSSDEFKPEYKSDSSKSP